MTKHFGLGTSIVSASILIASATDAADLSG